MCKDKLISLQHGGRESRGVNNAKMELLLGAKEKGYHKEGTSGRPRIHSLISINNFTFLI